tara:strand:+ start:343 stop:600 length:258 start_codon:yes stop_codon:yes gene_type:complete
MKTTRLNKNSGTFILNKEDTGGHSQTTRSIRRLPALSIKRSRGMPNHPLSNRLIFHPRQKISAMIVVAEHKPVKTPTSRGKAIQA